MNSDYSVDKDGNHHCPECDKVLAKVKKGTSGTTFCCDLSISFGRMPDPILDYKSVEKKLKEMNLSHAQPPEDDMCCWILSDGSFYHETFMNHINTAYNLYEKGVIPEGMDDERYIEKCWVKCTRSIFGGMVTIAMQGKPTARQLNSIIKLAEKHPEEFFDKDKMNHVPIYFKVENDRRLGITKWSQTCWLMYNSDTGKVKLEKERHSRV